MKKFIQNNWRFLIGCLIAVSFLLELRGIRNEFSGVKSKLSYIDSELSGIGGELSGMDISVQSIADRIMLLRR